MKLNRTQTRLLCAVLIAAAAVPLLNTALLGSLVTMLASDVMIPAAASEVLGYVSGIITVASVYASFACLAFAAVTGELRRVTALIVGLAAPLVYLAAGIVDAAFYGAGIINGAYVTYSAVSCLFELLRFGAALLVCLLIARAAKKRGEIPAAPELLSVRGPLSAAAVGVSIVVAVSMLLSNLSETAALLMQYGAPVNASEMLTLVSPYITTGIYAILGYFLVYILLRVLRRGTEIHEEKRTINGTDNQTGEE